MKIFSLYILTDKQLYRKYNEFKIKEQENKIKEEEDKKQREIKRVIERKKKEEWDKLVKEFSEKGYILDTEFDWSLNGGGWHYTITNKDNLSSTIKKRHKYEIEEFIKKI